MSARGTFSRPHRQPVVGVCMAALVVMALGPSPSSRATAGTALSGRIVFVSTRNGSADIYVMNADGTDQTRLTSDPDYEYSPRWSPDGTAILFERLDSYGSHLYLMRPDGTGLHRVPGSRWQEDASWSPEGARIVYTLVGLQYRNLGAERPDGTHRHRILEGPFATQRPDWSADGRWIAFDGTVDSLHSIYRVRPDGTGLVTVTYGPRTDAYPRWSPDDRTILFVRNISSGSDLLVMDPDGGGQTYLTNDGGLVTNTTPCWSPGGTMIAFASDRDASRSSVLDIYVMNADGSGVTRLTDGGGNYSPDWTPAA